MKTKASKIDGVKTGRQIALYLDKEGVPIQELADYLSVSVNAVRNWLKGENLPATERMYEICKRLNVDIKDIMIEIDGDK